MASSSSDYHETLSVHIDMQTQQKSFKHVPLSLSRALRLVKDIEFNRTRASHASWDLSVSMPALLIIIYRTRGGPPLIDSDEDGTMPDFHSFEHRIKAKEKEGFFPIQRNLFETLCQLIQSTSAKSTQCIWIDAICINQNDVREENLKCP